MSTVTHVDTHVSTHVYTHVVADLVLLRCEAMDVAVHVHELGDAADDLGRRRDRHERRLVVRALEVRVGERAAEPSQLGADVDERRPVRGVVGPAALDQRGQAGRAVGVGERQVRPAPFGIPSAWI